MHEPFISVIIRARDEAASIGRCLERVASQRLEAGRSEVIVVDSGSRDGTVAIASQSGAQVLEIAPDSFTFGGALNLGAGNARGQLLVALSADAAPPDPNWLARLAQPVADPRVACASGGRHLPDGLRLTGRVLQDESLALDHPDWGYSNGAGAFRAELWRQRPFRADLPGCEDLEWSLHWLARGYLCVIDPGLAVDHDHTHDPLRSVYRRARREAQGIASFRAQPPYGPAALVRDWWSDLRFYDSAPRARLSHRRAARLLGAYAGRRRAASQDRDQPPG
jgi:rhamnosyltransferase